MDINFCPMCMFQPNILNDEDGYVLECPYCGRRSRRAASPQEAIRNWNHETFDEFCNMQDYLHHAVVMTLE